ncbi:MAG: heme ABC exporter ATP-binding protein CcmA, partial [Rhodoferax sp.]|nr:heme ABC exporter ATP-binding protein CcmA [Rhodoferax sp.]
CVWLRGRNGAGKTTLLRVLIGLLPADEGQVRWPIAGAAVPLQPNLLYIGHATALKEDLSVLEALQFLARLQGLPADPAQLDAALGRLSLQGHAQRRVRTLSQGQRRRLALARLALDTSRRLWVLDEPLEALDEPGQLAVQALLQQHLSGGGSLLVTSHLPLGDGLAPRLEVRLGPGEG